MNSPTPELLQLGQLMCDATQNVLWSRYRGLVRDATPKAELSCRPGRGKATYHRYHPRERVHLITYGLQMIAAKHDPVGAAGWLSTREIRGRGYFDGEVSVLNLLAHTCNHEFAHLLQQNAGKRFHGSVHNRHFYGLLDHLNAQGEADAVRDYLRDQARSRQLMLPDETLPIIEAPAIPDWQTGDPVSFGSHDTYREGRIRRINRKTCTVDGTGRWAGTGYRVPFVMLRDVAPDPSQ